jgi:hypothetical protein
MIYKKILFSMFHVLHCIFELIGSLVLLFISPWAITNGFQWRRGFIIFSRFSDYFLMREFDYLLGKKRNKPQ